MIDSQDELAARLRSCHRAVLWLALVAALLFVAEAMVAFARHEGLGVLTSFVAVAITLASAAAALYVTALFLGTSNAVSGILFGIFLRTACPFLLSILLTEASSPLADAGLFVMVLLNFLVMLAVETILLVRIAHAHTSTVFR